MFQFLKQKAKALTSALSKTASFFSKRLTNIFRKPMDAEQIEALEELLYEADLGSEVVQYLIDAVEKQHKRNSSSAADDYLNTLEDSALQLLEKNIPSSDLPIESGKAKIIFVVGVNGSGKTTSIAKLGKKYQDENKKVLFACGDTFRAAAKEQLEIHAKKLSIDTVSSGHGVDPASIIYDAIKKRSDYDVIICDTAGRLESKTSLLDELKKMISVAKKFDENAPHEVLLTIDAGLGQTCVEQVEKFQAYAPISGLILTKIDSTSKGGVALSIYKKHHIPIKYVGYGETICDFSPFYAKSYARALFKE